MSKVHSNSALLRVWVCVCAICGYVGMSTHIPVGLYETWVHGVIDST